MIKPEDSEAQKVAPLYQDRVFNESPRNLEPVHKNESAGKTRERTQSEYKLNPNGWMAIVRQIKFRPNWNWIRERKTDIMRMGNELKQFVTAKLS